MKQVNVKNISHKPIDIYFTLCYFVFANVERKIYFMSKDESNFTRLAKRGIIVCSDILSEFSNR